MSGSASGRRQATWRAEPARGGRLTIGWQPAGERCIVSHTKLAKFDITSERPAGVDPVGCVMRAAACCLDSFFNSRGVGGAGVGEDHVGRTLRKLRPPCSVGFALSETVGDGGRPLQICKEWDCRQ